MPYLCYKLNPESKKKLMEQFPPQYPCVKYDHITICLCDKRTEVPSQPQKITVIGMANDSQGIQTFLVKVDEHIHRPTDQCFWHITASFNPQKKAPAEFDLDASDEQKKEKNYSAVTSNGFLMNLLDEMGNVKKQVNPNWKIQFFEKPILIQATPCLQFFSSELKQKIKNSEK